MKCNCKPKPKPKPKPKKCYGKVVRLITNTQRVWGVGVRVWQ